ncbi:MAG: toll/interleukin-1 receptor domain-containing protein [Actinomycetota bacterium]|nr:toll/interleukin-1 receptor domain-containing protein [Actinomycetota bacterium]
MVQRWDAFVSYAHEDEAWVGVLAENLHRPGRDVFFDRWEIVGGSRLSERLQQGLESSAAVVLVVSRAAVSKPWWREEFAAAMAGAVAGVQRLIPVLLDDVALPPFVAGRVWVDFRQLDSPAAYEDRFAELLRAVAGRPAGDRPQRTGALCRRRGCTGRRGRGRPGYASTGSRSCSAAPIRSGRTSRWGWTAGCGRWCGRWPGHAPGTRWCCGRRDRPRVCCTAG